MLVLQAAYAQTIWFGTQFDSADLTRILRLLSGDMAKKRLHDVYGKQNIVLCGFMGSGKTTIGRKLARALQYEFVDMDDYLEKREGKKISDIFAEVGESGFRDIETDCAREISDRTGCVIALGGGAVMTALCRTKASGFTLEQCYTFEQVTEFCRRGTLAEHLIPTDRLFASLPELHLTEQQSTLYGNGVKLALSRVEGILPEQDLYRVYGADGSFFGTAQADRNADELRVGKNMK